MPTEREPGNPSSRIHTAARARTQHRAVMAVRAGALTSPVGGLAQYGRAPHEHSRGRQSPATVQGTLAFPAAGRRLLPSAALRCGRSDSRRAPEAEACWRGAAAPATAPWGGCSRLAVTCGAGIAQPGEVCCCGSAEVGPGRACAWAGNKAAPCLAVQPSVLGQRLSRSALPRVALLYAFPSRLLVIRTAPGAGRSHSLTPRIVISHVLL